MKLQKQQMLHKARLIQCVIMFWIHPFYDSVSLKLEIRIRATVIIIIPLVNLTAKCNLFLYIFSR